MASTNGALTALNQVCEIATDDNAGGVLGIQYGSKGADNATAATGTIVAEVSNDGTDWYAKKITKNDDTVVDNLAAAGYGSIKLQGAQKARVRMSVAGGAQGVRVFLNTQAT